MAKKIYCFTDRKGQTFLAGKSHYPDFIRIDLTRHTAWDVVHSLLRELQKPVPHPEDFLQVTLFGQLETEYE